MLIQETSRSITPPRSSAHEQQRARGHVGRGCLYLKTRPYAYAYALLCGQRAQTRGFFATTSASEFSTLHIWQLVVDGDGTGCSLRNCKIAA